MSKERKGAKPNRTRTGNSFLDAMSRYGDLVKAQKDKAIADPNLTDVQKAEEVARADAKIGIAFKTYIRVLSDQSSQVNNRGFRR